MASYLDRNGVTILAVALLCVFAISAGAGAIDSIVSPGGPGGGDDFGMESEEAADRGNEGENGTIAAVGGEGGGGSVVDPSTCIRFLHDTPGTMLYFLSAVGFFYFLSRRFSPSFAMLTAYALTPIILIVYFLVTACGTAGGVAPGQGADNSSVVGGMAEESITVVPEISPLWLVAIFGIAVVGAVALLYSETGDETIEIEEDADEEPDVSDIAAAAGEAADRLEKRNADVDNEVYRAWREMTHLLDVPKPESSTPGEFADAAVELGLERRHVDELTRLFEEVRYGHKDAAEREERALSVFRNIEDEYSERTDDSSGQDETQTGGSDDETQTGSDER